MAEEVKEVKAEVVQSDDAVNKANLKAFILSIVGIVIGTGWIIGGIAGIILCAMSLKTLKTAGVPNKKPFSIFRRVAKPVGIVGLITSIGFVILYTVLLITSIVAAVLAATQA